MGIISELGAFLEKKEGQAFIILFYLVLFYFYIQSAFYVNAVVEQVQKNCCDKCNTYLITNDSIFNFTGRYYA